MKYHKKLLIIKDNFYAYMIFIISISFIIKISVVSSLVNDFFTNPFTTSLIYFLVITVFFGSIKRLRQSIKSEVVMSFRSLSKPYFVILFFIICFFFFDNGYTKPITAIIQFFTDNIIILTAVYFFVSNVYNYYLFKAINEDEVIELKEKTKKISNQKFSVFFRGTETVYRVGSYRCYRQGIVIAGKTISYTQLKEFLDSINKSFDEMTKDDFDLLEMYCIN